MKTTMVMLLAAIFMVLGVFPASSDVSIIVWADLSKIKTVSENSVYSEEVIFEDGKAVWQGYGKFYFAFYNEKALKDLVQDDSTKVFLAPYGEGVVPSFGNLYIVLKNIFGSVGTETYGLEAETFYVWPVKFPAPLIRLKDSDGAVSYKGIAPFGDGAIETMKASGRRITKNFFASLKMRK
ncbi:MAG: hypothetical protein WC619_00155 [Patescibacteria group bacterium]